MNKHATTKTCLDSKTSDEAVMFYYWDYDNPKNNSFVEYKKSERTLDEYKRIEELFEKMEKTND